MMRIAILGATSQIARDLIALFAAETDADLHLFARRPEAVIAWLRSVKLDGRYPVHDFSAFPGLLFEAIINFVGVGNPAQAMAMGNTIFEVTERFDTMALDYLREHPTCRYLFLSSGAVYGGQFTEPANWGTPAVIAINRLAPYEWYGVAKLYAECRHRAHPELAIFDIRVFNYFSRTQDIEARFLITDIVRAIRDKVILQISPDYILRDFLHPSDFYALVKTLLIAPACNTAVDCYSRRPIDKPGLLAAMKERFGLRYETVEVAEWINATGNKPHYYSLNRRAAEFGYQPQLASLEGVMRETQAIVAAQEIVGK